MKIPHLKYIEALVASKKTLEQIQEHLENYGLEANDKVIAEVMKTLRSEKPDYFSGAEPADLDWIRDLEIEEMFTHLAKQTFPEEIQPIQGAIGIINDPLMYRLVTAVCIAGISDEDIEILVSGDYNRDYGVEDVKLFIKYFFNLEGWNLREKQEYVKGIHKTELSKYYKIALKGDKPYLFWKLGASPEKDFGLMLKDVLNDSYYKFKEESKIRPELAQKWGNLLLRIHDRIESHEKDKEDKVSNFMEKFEFEIKSDKGVSDEKPRHISELD